MAGILSVSRTNLAQRRQKLRRQRQLKIIQAIWRTLAVTGFASALFWVAIQPMWVLKDSDQIVIKSGDSEVRTRTQVLTKKDIHGLLELSSPQSLWRVEPSVIADALRKQPHIAQAKVSRRLLPPGLIIDIQERVPVAIAQISKDKAVTSCVLNFSSTGKSADIKSCLQTSDQVNKKDEIGLLDASGTWMPLSSYISINPKAKLPRLIVIGSIAQYKVFWTQIYEAISQSSLKVTEINFQDPTNLTLKTELGNVYLGSPSNRLPEQIQALVQMRRLGTEVNSSKINYIDLKNPSVPLVRMN